MTRLFILLLIGILSGCNDNFVLDTNHSTRLISVISQTTNNTPLTVTGVGFTPKGAIVNAFLCDTGSGERGNTDGFIDSDGNQVSICTKTSGTLVRNPSSAAAVTLLMVVGEYYEPCATNVTTWTGWTSDGATFSRSVVGTPATNNIYLDFYFYR